MKAYKVTGPEYTCQGFLFEVGKTYEHKGEIKLCGSGFHACLKPVDCFNYYSFNKDNHVFEVKMSGEIIHGDDKSVCSIIEITRELNWHEVLDLVNTGHSNTGHSNTGHWNSGDENTGDRNSGDRNSGDRNSGDRNSGDRNSGNWNSGNSNTGDRNSGDENSGNWNSGHSNSGNWNSGDRNSGDGNSGDGNSGEFNSGNWNSGDRNSGEFNSGNFNSGIFNTDSPKLRAFNKETDIDFQSLSLLSMDGFVLNEWIEEEQKLKTYSYKEAWSNFWNKIDENHKKQFLDLPNFDPDIFEEITGIRV